MQTLRPISPVSLPPQPERSMAPASVSRLPALPSQLGASAIPSPPSKLPLLASSPLRTLDFDIETVAAGFADPQWVPNRVTCWAYAWTDDRDVRVDALPPASFYDHQARREFLSPLMAALDEADVVTGHNIVRFDLPILNTECLRLNLPTLRPKLVQDTIRLPKSKGFKKGQDNLGHTLDVAEEKLPLSWAEWEAAYGEPGMVTVKERCASDVRMHLEMREAMRARGWLSAPRMWRP
jgi:DNA polymerase elongation subunit (family B)